MIMAKDLNPTDLGRVTSLTSEAINETDMVTFDTEIYRGAISQQKAGSQSPTPGRQIENEKKKEDHNLLYAQTASSTVNRHPTVRAVRTLSADRPVICSLDSLDAIQSSPNCHNRFLTILLVLAFMLAVVSVIAAVVAYFSVLGDECSCDSNNLNGKSICYQEVHSYLIISK